MAQGEKIGFFKLDAEPAPQDLVSGSIYWIVKQVDDGSGNTILYHDFFATTKSNPPEKINLDAYMQSVVDGKLALKFDKPNGTIQQYIRGDGSIASFPSGFGSNIKVIELLLIQPSQTELISNCFNALANFEIKGDELYLIRFSRTEDDGSRADVIKELYLFKKGKGNYGVGGDVTVDTDFALISSTVVNRIEGNSPTVYMIEWADIDTPEDAVNNSDDTYVIGSGDVVLFVVIKPNQSEYVSYLFVGATGTYGDHANTDTASSADFQLVEKQKKDEPQEFGDMVKAVYDPNNIEKDVFNRANHINLTFDECLQDDSVTGTFVFDMTALKGSYILTMTGNTTFSITNVETSVSRFFTFYLYGDKIPTFSGMTKDPASDDYDGNGENLIWVDVSKGTSITKITYGIKNQS